MNLPTNKETKNYIIAFALFATSVFTSNAIHQNDINKLKENEKTLHNKISILSQEITSKDERIKKINNNIQAKDERLNEYKGEVSDYKKEINELKENNKKLQEERKELKKKQQAAQNKSKEKQVSRGQSSSRSSANWTDTYEVTAYHAGFESTGKSPGDNGYGVTASGATVQEGRTIACPPEIPLGTKIDIETVGVRVCEDRGGAIKGKILDLYIADANKVWDWGRKKLKIKILN